MRTVENIDKIIKTFNTDEDFLNYVQSIYKENEDGQPYKSEIHWLPENIQQATEYIVEYCPDLKLTEIFDEENKQPAHISTYPHYSEVRGIINREKSGLTCTEDESAIIKQWIKNTTLCPDNGSIQLNAEIQAHLPCEYGEALTEMESDINTK